MSWKRATLAVVCMFIVSGCGALFEFRTTKMPTQEPLVRPSPEHVEREREALAWAEGAFDRIEQGGAPIGAAMPGQGRDLVAAVRARIGQPAAALAVLESVTEPSPEVETLRAELARLNGRLRERETKWRDRYERKHHTPDEKGWTVGSGLLRWLTGSGLVFVFVFVGLGVVGVPVIPFLFKALRGTRRTLRQVVQGIEDWRNDTNPQAQKGVLDRIGNQIGADEQSKRRVREVRADYRAGKIRG